MENKHRFRFLSLFVIALLYISLLHVNASSSSSENQKKLAGISEDGYRLEKSLSEVMSSATSLDSGKRSELSTSKPR
ncbi:hypothetical protein V7O62_00225 [Methanolobus sp. ZRKC2]|uniref:hypothetical protein n=1 Tax=Methanolobus sp. ZRKC2 TaxID=3125783 RepID=UPI0032434B19